MPSTMQQQLPFRSRTQSLVVRGGVRPAATLPVPARLNGASTSPVATAVLSRCPIRRVPVGGRKFAAARFARAIELCGACMLIVTFMAVALFG